MTSRVILKRKKEKLFVALDFKNNLTKDTLVDSRAYVSATVQNDLDTMKRRAPNKNFKTNDPPSFQIQIANGQLEKPLETTTLNFDVGDSTFAEQFVVMKKLPRPIIGLHFMRNNGEVIDTRHGLTHFPHPRMQIKTASK